MPKSYQELADIVWLCMYTERILLTAGYQIGHMPEVNAQDL